MARQTFSEVGYPTICRPGPLAGVRRPAAVLFGLWDLPLALGAPWRATKVV